MTIFIKSRTKFIARSRRNESSSSKVGGSHAV